MEFNLSANTESSSLFAPREGEAVQKVTVPTIDLETFVRSHAVPQADVLKVDIEGAEIRLFEAVSDPFLTTVTQISVEFHDFNGLVDRRQVNALKHRLTRLGFLSLKFSMRSNFDVLFLNSRLSRSRCTSRWKLRLAPYYLKLLHLTGNAETLGLASRGKDLEQGQGPLQYR
jgi:hypothetical protein